MNQQETDAMMIANTLATLQVTLAAEEGSWHNLTEKQRSDVMMAKRKGVEYIEKYDASRVMDMAPTRSI